MNIDGLKAAMIEAERFIKKADIAICALEDDHYKSFGSKETGAAKRASMDLTRALSEMRKPRQ